jgi:membrane protease YdiL (CAAX protease family)
LSPIRRIRPLLLTLGLAALAIAGVALAYRFLVWPALVALFEPGEGVATQLRRFGILGAVMFGYWLWVRFAEKRPVRELRPAPVGAAVGLLSGVALMAIALLPLFLSGAYAVTAQRGLQPGLLEIAGFLFVAAMLEELVYRGVLFQSLEKTWGTRAALWLQAVVFGVGHLENVVDGNAWDVAATVVSVTLLGAMWALLFVHFRNLWLCGLNHFAWNFTIVLSGVPLSGIEDWRAAAPFTTEYRAPDWLTGGLFGPENSAVTLVVVVVAVALLWQRAKSRSQLLRAAPTAP